MKSVGDIDLEKIADELSQYAEQWVAISAENRIVGHGTTYREAIENVQDPSEVVLLKVPPLDASLAPGAS